MTTPDRPAPPGQAAADSTPSLFLPREEPSMAARIAALGERRFVRSGEYVYRQGSVSSYFYQVVTGRFRLFLSRPDGSERVLSYAEPGASFGESTCFDELPRYASCVAMTDAEILAIARDAVIAAGRRHPELLLEMTRRISHKARLFSMHVAIDGLPARARVAMVLDHMVQAYGRVESDASVHLKVRYSVDELAGMIGTTRVTASRELSRLVADAVVMKQGRDIVVLDTSALRSIARDYWP